MILRLLLILLILIICFYLCRLLINKSTIKKHYRNIIITINILIIAFLAFHFIANVNLIKYILNYIELSLYALSFKFIRRAIIVGSLVAFSSAFLGTFLVLKKYSMIGDGLAHVSFASVTISLVAGLAPLTLSIPIVIIASYLILKLTEKAEIHGDASIGLISSFSVALGILIASLSKGININIDDYLFGSILTITNSDVTLTIVLSLIILLIIIFFYHSFFAITYDEEFAKVSGINTKLFNYVLSILTAVTITIGISIIGTLLISSMIIFPTVSSLQIAKGFKQTMIISTITSLFCVILGILTSFVVNIPPGPAIVMMNSSVFLVLFSIKKLNR